MHHHGYMDTLAHPRHPLKPILTPCAISVETVEAALKHVGVSIVLFNNR